MTKYKDVMKLHQAISRDWTTEIQANFIRTSSAVANEYVVIYAYATYIWTKYTQIYTYIQKEISAIYNNLKPFIYIFCNIKQQ